MIKKWKRKKEKKEKGEEKGFPSHVQITGGYNFLET